MTEWKDAIIMVEAYVGITLDGKESDNIFTVDRGIRHDSENQQDSKNWQQQ